MQYYYTKNFIGLGTVLALVFFIFTTACAKKRMLNTIKSLKSMMVTLLPSLQVVFFRIFFVKTERVRLIGIDAPELAQEPWGRRAKNHLRKLIKESDWQVKIELDVQHRDRYGRILAYLWDKQGRMLNYMMVRDGYAVIYTVPPNVKYAEWLLQAQRLAREEKKKEYGAKMDSQRLLQSGGRSIQETKL